MACYASGHHLNCCWLIVTNFNDIWTKIHFSDKIHVKNNVVCMSDILYRPQCVNTRAKAQLNMSLHNPEGNSASSSGLPADSHTDPDRLPMAPMNIGHQKQSSSSLCIVVAWNYVRNGRNVSPKKGKGEIKAHICLRLFENLKQRYYKRRYYIYSDIIYTIILWW